MTAVVADTHAIIWYLVEPQRLSTNAVLSLDKATNTGQSIYISTISIVEICYLVEKKKLPELFSSMALTTPRHSPSTKAAR